MLPRPMRSRRRATSSSPVRTVALLGLLLLGAAAHAGDPDGCPGEGDCLEANGSPGCSDEACCAAVCSLDPFCCETAWDATCAETAERICDAAVCPGTGDCFEANGSPGCDDGSCCSTVCALDPFCCDVTWDGRCAALALKSCDPADPCPGAGGCFDANGTPGCEDEACCAAVCAVDPFCCEVEWDGKCAAIALESCGGDLTCPGEGGCLAANGTPGCDDATCCEVVCAIEPFCCEIEWDETCAALAADQCGLTNPACPGEGGCLVANGTPGCSDADCCSIVCGIDPFCCDVEWDGQCAESAQMLCDGGGAACPGSGGCFAVNATPGCDDASCCEAVCAIDPFCCETEWDGKCVAIAETTCDPGDVCPGEGDCLEANGTPGCADEACCATVCAIDAFCCDVAWDGKCALLAAELCVDPCKSTLVFAPRRPVAPLGFAPGDSVEVVLRFADLCRPAAGVQAFVRFDPDHLEFVEGAYTDEPFGTPIIDPISATPDGAIDLASGIDPLAGQSPTAADSVLAVLTFTALTFQCDPSTSLEFRRGGPTSMLTDAVGNPIEPLNLVSDLEATCEADTNLDGTVDVDDVMAVIMGYGRTTGCRADVDGSGVVDVDDLILVILRFGPCSQ